MTSAPAHQTADPHPGSGGSHSVLAVQRAPRQPASNASPFIQRSTSAAAGSSHLPSSNIGAQLAQLSRNPGGSAGAVLQLQRSYGNQAVGGVIQRKCACGGNPGLDDECPACRARRMAVQRQAAGPSASAGLPASVHQALRSDVGTPMLPAIRQPMERAFGADLSAVRVHTGSQAAQAAQDINAEAFTVGRDIYFNAGRYPASTLDRKKLLAHELTHTLQQRNGNHLPQASLSVSQPGDPQELEAEAVSSRVVAQDAGSTGAISALGTAQIQRYSFGDFVDDLESAGETVVGGAEAVGSAVASGAEAVGGAVVSGAEAVGGAVVSGAEAVGGAVVRGAEAVGGAVVSGVEAVGSAVEGAVDWLATEAGQIAQRIAGFFGVSVRITASGLEITLPKTCPIPAIPLDIPLPGMSGDLMAPIFNVPIGPDVFLTGEIGIAGSLTPEAQIQLGPICLVGVRILINPITNSYNISGGLSATAAAALGVEIRGGLRGELGVEALVPIGPVIVPISAPLVGLEGGIAGMVRGIGAGTITIGGGLSFGGGIITQTGSSKFDIGLAADAFLGAYGQLDILGNNLCRIYWQPYEWHTDMGLSLGLSFNMKIIPGFPPIFIPTIKPPTLSRIPFSQFPLALNRQGFTDDCPIKDRLCDLLRILKLLPSQNGGVWSWTGAYGPGRRLAGPLLVYEKKPPRASGAECRGACGPDCITCEHIPLYRYTDPITGAVWEYTNYQICNSHEGCRQHDAAFDWAADKKGEIGKWAIVMPWHMAANIECTCDNLAGNCVAWIAGLPPYDSQMYFADTAVMVKSPAPKPKPGLGHRTSPAHIPLSEARRVVQEASARIARLVRERPDPAQDPEGAARIDRMIEAIERERQEALIQVVQADNPLVEVVDRTRGIFRVPVTDEQGRTQYVYGSILVMWHVQDVSPGIWRLSTQIGSQTHEPGVTTRLSVAGTAVQGRVQPFPGDVDFVEEIDIQAGTAIEAGRALARTVIEFVQRNTSNTNLEFLRMLIMYQEPQSFGGGRPMRSSAWSKADLLAAGRGGRAFDRLAEQLSRADRGINTFWRTRMDDGRFIDITKVLSVQAMTAGGVELFSTPRLGRLNAAYLDQPETLPSSSLGEFAAAMRENALALADDHQYLKAAKRAYNFFTVTGNLEAMRLLEPAFRTDEARVNQQASVVEAISRSLSERPSFATEILTRDEAQRQLTAAADVIERLPADPNLTPGPREVAERIRDISRRLEADQSGLLKPDNALSRALGGEHRNLKHLIDQGLEPVVRPIIDRYLR